MALVYLSLRVLKLEISEYKNKKLSLHFFHKNHHKGSVYLFLYNQNITIISKNKMFILWEIMGQI